MIELLPHQKKALKVLNSNHESGTLHMTMRSMKTRIVIEYIKCRTLSRSPYERILWLAYDKDERDNDLKSEFKKWKAQELFNKHVTVILPASLHKVDLSIYDLIIYNECHNISEKRAGYFTNTNVNARIIGLTGTYPNNKNKQALLTKINLNNILYKFNIKDAINSGAISNFKINIIEVPLDTEKNQRISYKDNLGNNKIFYTSEQSSIANFENKILQIDTLLEPFNEEKLKIQLQIDKYKDYHSESFDNKKELRKLYTINSNINDQCKPYWNNKKILSLRMMKTLNKLPSKVRACKNYILQADMLNQRTIVFAQDTNHALAIGDRVYNSKTNSKYYDEFQKNKPGYLILIEKAATGSTYNMVDNINLLNINSSNTSILQKLGRGMLKDLDNLQVNIFISQNTKQLEWITKALIDIDDKMIQRTVLDS